MAGSDFASFLIGMGTTPGTEINDAVIPTSPRISSPPKRVPTTRLLPGHLPSNHKPYHYRRPALGHLRRARQSVITAWNTSIPRHATRDGVSYTGAEIYVNSGNRRRFTTNLKDFGPRLGFAWQPVQALVVRGGGGYLLRPQPADGGRHGARQRWLLHPDALECHLLQRRWQYGVQRHISLFGRGAGQSRAQRHRHLFAEQSISQRSCSDDQFALGTGQQPGQLAEHHAPLAAHADHLQLQLWRGV